jgi:LacI family transcriptional regulator
MLTGPEGAYETEERNIGYTQALDEAGIDVKGSLIYCGDFFVDSGSEMTKRLIESRQPFTAVFAHSDRMAIGCISALWEAGYRVPEDVAVIGYNDIPISRYVLPPLTTVRYPTFELGQLCTKLLIEKTNGVKNPEKNLTSEELESLEPRLIIRRSCGACLSTM